LTLQQGGVALRCLGLGAGKNSLKSARYSIYSIKISKELLSTLLRWWKFSKVHSLLNLL